MQQMGHKGVHDRNKHNMKSRKTASPNWFSIGMDAWALAAESNMVIAMRMGALAFGGPSAVKGADGDRESRREHGAWGRSGDGKIGQQPRTDRQRQHRPLYPAGVGEPAAIGLVTERTGLLWHAF
jgi:hypothetical protein